MSLKKEQENVNERELLYKVFNWLRFPLMVLVVFIHVKAPNASDYASLAGVGIYDMFKRAISLVLAQIAVPMFFFISGYLFFNRLQEWDWSIYSEKLKKRCKTLLLPYLLWNTIGILFVAFALLRHGGVVEVKDYFCNVDCWKLYWCSRVWAGPPDWLGMTHAVTSPLLQPLWFLRDLMVVTVLSPLLWCLFRYTRVWGLLLLLLCFLSQIFPSVPGITAASLFFFGAGGYMNMNHINPTQLTWRNRYIVYAVAVVLWVIVTMLIGYDDNGRPMNSLVSPFFVVFGSLAMMNIATASVKKGYRYAAILTGSTFFIYVSHALLLEFGFKISKVIFGSGSTLMLLFRYLFSVFLIIVICVAVYWLLNRFTPRLCGILTGKR